MRRLLMVGIAETVAGKTMVRSHNGIRGAFVVETASGGKSGLAVQLEGSTFETVWQLKEAGRNGILDLNKVGMRLDSWLFLFGGIFLLLSLQLYFFGTTNRFVAVGIKRALMTNLCYV